MIRFFVAAAALAAAPALGQDYPAREIRSICNFAPGSGADIIVRYYSDQLAKLAGWFNQITAAEETRQFLERWGGFVKLARIQPQ